MNIQKFILQNKHYWMLANTVFITLAIIAKLSGQNQLHKGTLIIASIIGGIPIAIQAFRALRVKVVSIDVLVTIAVIGAFLIGEFTESAVVTFLFLFGSYLEQKTLEKTRHSIQELTQMAPATALKITENQNIEEVDIDFIEKGDLLLVKTGAQVPVDGFIVEGSGYLDEASVTGESRQVKKNSGDLVFAGTFLENGTLQIQTKKVGEETTFGKIIELVEEAQDSQSKTEKIIDRFAQYYTPVVLILALFISIFTKDIRLAITILVLGCPGALVIGVPVSNVAGIGNGAKHGILLKGGEVITKFSQVDTMIFDKTGTLTQGKPSVATVHTYQEEAVAWQLTASVERESSHPLAQAILAKKEVAFLPVTETTVIKGQGIRALVDEKNILIGNQLLLDTHGIHLTTEQVIDLQRLQKEGQSTVLVAIDQQVALLIGIIDQLRPDAKETLATLKKNGIKQLILLSGDNQATVDLVADQLQMTEAHGHLLPEDKAAFVKKLQEKGQTVAFVGDGINDSPSLALADIGIAMGGGTDVALETSDVILMQSNLKKLIHALTLTRKTILNMRENIFIAIATVAVLLIGLFFGSIHMSNGMFIHEASILIVILNAMRLRFHQKN